MSHTVAIGRTLQALRQNLEISRENLAARLKMPLSAVERHETGKKAPTLDEMLRYLRVLRCTSAEFERIKADLERCRGRTEQWWQQSDLMAPEDGLDELGDDFARLARRFAAEMVKKLGEHH